MVRLNRLRAVASPIRKGGERPLSPHAFLPALSAASTRDTHPGGGLSGLLGPTSSHPSCRSHLASVPQYPGFLVVKRSSIASTRGHRERRGNRCASRLVGCPLSAPVGNYTFARRPAIAVTLSAGGLTMRPISAASLSSASRFS